MDTPVFEQENLGTEHLKPVRSSVGFKARHRSKLGQSSCKSQSLTMSAKVGARSTTLPQSRVEPLPSLAAKRCLRCWSPGRPGHMLANGELHHYSAKRLRSAMPCFHSPRVVSSKLRVCTWRLQVELSLRSQEADGPVINDQACRTRPFLPHVAKAAATSRSLSPRPLKGRGAWTRFGLGTSVDI